MSEKNISVAASAGFCFGVRRAVRLAEEAPQQHPGKKIRTLGPIIHNPQVVGRLREKGVGQADSLDEVDEGVVIIRSHGITREHTAALAANRALTVIDATCPYVRRAQEIVAEMSAAGYQIIIIGEPDHPEVQGLISYGTPERTLVVSSAAELPRELFAPGKPRRLAVLAQTTQSQTLYLQTVTALLQIKGELRCFNTICTATSERQEEALKMAGECDLMLIIGGRNSANTNRLWEICRALQPDTFHIETLADIRPEWLTGKHHIGISAGASTPKWLIDEVRHHLENTAPPEKNP